MKTEPIVPAVVDFDSDPAAPRAPAFDDLYHPREGALAQARDVFLAGNGLPERWRGRARFTILETGFGLGHNFLATWAAWREDPRRCERLSFVSLEKHPLTRSDLARALAACPWPALARQLVQAWPALTPNLHPLEFESGRVRLLLGLGDATALAREMVASVDAFFLDGFAPARNAPMWDARLFAALARQAADGATAATWSAARAVRDGLAGAGFVVEAARGPGSKRDITLARYAPHFRPPRPPGRRIGEAPSHAVVVGAGIAGALTARALAARGVHCTVLEAEAAPARGASGNPAGLFHGTVGIDDGPHARVHRAASLFAARQLRPLIDQGAVAGAVCGLLRLRSSDPGREHFGLPASYVQALDAAEASALAGLPVREPAWLLPEAGHVDPGAWIRCALSAPGLTCRTSEPVQRIERHPTGWRAIGRSGRVLADAPLMVLANAHDALRLAGLPSGWARQVRGQVSWTDAASAWPQRLPIASGGYILPLPDGRLLIGATQQPDDLDAQVRQADHLANLAAARQLLGRDVVPDGTALQGRVGWRVVTRDRLPLVGPLPDLDAALPRRRDAPRLVARRGGLFVHSALGSRGLTTAALCAELIAAQVTGEPWPLEADLVDALDPARLALR